LIPKIRIVFGENHMAKTNDNLLKQAIADAKAVKETALANAKLALTEAFTPKLQSMLSSKLRNEMEGDFEEGDLNNPTGAQQEVNPTKLDIAKEAKDVTANADSDPEAEKAGAVAGGGGQGLEQKQGSGVKTVYEAEGEEEEVPGEEGGELGEVPPGAEGEVAPEVGAEVAPEGGEVAPEGGEELGAEVPEEDETELESIIRELEMEEEPGAEPFAGEETPEEEEAEKLQGGVPAEEAKDVTAIASQDPEKGLAGDVGPQSGSETAVETNPTVGQDTVGAEGEELDLESLVKEIEGEMGQEGEDEEEKEKMEFENLRKENVTLRKSLKEHRSVVVYLRDRLNEINLLNAKLLYSNKLFRGNSLSEGQKLRVVEAIDRANTIREVKLVYATLAESFKAKGAKLNESKKPVASASKTVKSTKPVAETKVITEGADLAARFKSLAGVKKVSRIL
jgi:hypothetical protein